MSKLLKRELILAKVESTYNNDASPTAANDAILVENIGWSFAGARMIERTAVKPTLGQLQGIHAGTLLELSLDVELKGSGVAGTAPEIAPLLRSCGLSETINAGTSVEYAPASTNHESATIYYNEDGTRYALTGCRGTVSATFAVGEIAKASLTITGHISQRSDANEGSPTYDSMVPPPVLAAGFTVGSFAADISNIAIDLGNEIATPSSISSADGYGEILITDRNVSGSFDPLATLISQEDWYQDWVDGNNKAIDLSIGNDVGNQIALSIPTAYYRELSPGDRDGIRTYEVAYGATGDDAAFTLTFS